MKTIIEIVPFHAFPCEAEKFTIKGIAADKSDFGSNIDCDRENADDYACGCNEFVAIKPTKKVLDKYNITPEEYYNITHELESKFYVGSCGWCV